MLFRATRLSLLLFAFSCASFAQSGDTSGKVDLGIIVLPTSQAAQAALRQLEHGTNFAVLAKEKSIDASATDGGYVGSLAPSELRMELRNAVRGLKPGELSGVVQIPSGFAVLKVLTTPPPTSDLNPKRISALVATGAIRYGAQVSGLNEAEAALGDYPKPEGWNSDLPGTCGLRERSLAGAKKIIAEVLASKPEEGHDVTMRQRIEGHAVLAQLYSYSGEMDHSIAEWKTAYDLARTGDANYLPNLEESLGAAYLHKSEMENHIYTGSRDLDIFPPLHPREGFEKKEASRTAIRYFEEYLEHSPKDLEVRWLLNLAYATLGEYPSGVPKAYLIPESDFRSSQNVGRFIDVAQATGLNTVRAAGAVIADDFDNDGLLDVVVSSMYQCDQIRFFHNNGDGTFSDRTDQAHLSGQLGGLNIEQADYNNDGCMDILVLRGGWEFPQRMSLLRNNCDGTFTDVTQASGLNGRVTQTQAAAWADIDNDGYLDLFVADEKSPAQLFHNNGDGTFTEIGHAAGIDQTNFSKGVAAADYDGDGFMDFYVTNQHGVNLLYHNNGNLTFTEVGRQAGVQAPSYSFATWFFDYDNDGWPDLFVTSYMSSVDESVKTYLGQPHNAETLKLYRNRHDGTFEDVSAQVGLDKVFMPMGANFGDIDNDGYLDIYLGAGQPSFTALLPHVLLRNDGGKSFVDVTQSSGTGELHKGHGIAFADMSRRGREDILAEVGGAVPADRHVLRVFENPGNRNDWLNIRLVGVKSNREALGARIHVMVRNGKSAPRSIYRTVGQSSSFGANPLEQQIGLGADSHDITVDIAWPATGARQHFANVSKDRYIEIEEFAPGLTYLEHHPFELGRRRSPMTLARRDGGAANHAPVAQH